MYKSTDYEHEQLSFINFNMACGMQLDMNNEWIRIAQQLPWKAWEALYVAIFPSNTGNVAKPCRMVLGSLILQMRGGWALRIGSLLTSCVRIRITSISLVCLPFSTRLRSHGHCWSNGVNALICSLSCTQIICCVTRRRRLFVSVRNRAPLPGTAHCLLHRFAMPR